MDLPWDPWTVLQDVLANLCVLFPLVTEFDCTASVGAVRRPVCLEGRLRAAGAVSVDQVDWRCGPLATRDRFFRQAMQGVESPHCLCCGAAVEDDLHALVR